MPDDLFPLSDAAAAIKAAINNSDEWPGIATHLNGDGSRILAIDNLEEGEPTFWIITVTPARLLSEDGLPSSDETTG